ncbi:MAG: hypothetical protein RL293_643 [Bacteroidota bacterium]|jgi:hypothetical protein
MENEMNLSTKEFRNESGHGTVTIFNFYIVL